MNVFHVLGVILEVIIDDGSEDISIDSAILNDE